MELSDDDRERLFAARQHWTPDDELEQLPDLELLAEARRRGLPPWVRSVTRREVVDACREVTAALDAAPPPAKLLASLTKDELLAEAAARGVDVPSGARKADVLAALQAGADDQDAGATEPA